MIRAKNIVWTAMMLAAGFLVWPTDAYAQRRRAVRVAPRSVAVVGAYYRPWFYDPWYPYYGHPFGWYPPYAYAGAYDQSASLRLQAEPRHTEVFIDGYYAGTVDDFDGFFQRLRLEPGEHEIELYLEGHRSLRQKIYLQPRGTFRIRHAMQPMAPGETPDPRPIPPAGAQPPARYGAPGRPERSGPPEESERRSDFGTLSIRVQPDDAEIVIDGDAWEGGDGARLIVQLAAGVHTVEIRKEGYRPFRSEVRVRAGETAPLNVSLAPQ